MRSSWLAAVTVSACYAPSPQTGAPCIPAAANCPESQACVAGPGGYFCGGGGIDRPDAGTDAPATPSGYCFGTGVVKDLCFAEPPSGALSIAANTTIDTTVVGGGSCTEIRPQASGPALCVIAKQSIEIRSGVTLRAEGALPLVLIAGATLVVDGTLDAASKRTGTSGPGSRATCGAGIAGTQGQQDHGGGGGAGGSFGGLGAAGGVGDDMTPGGTPAATLVPQTLAGGCPGGAGGAGSGGGGAGVPGAGGGAVYLIASTISVKGAINASGAGGGGGTAGLDSSGGGAGGGAGGWIALDAPMLAVTGSVFANGGGGGGGGGNQVGNAGGPGGDPTAAATAATGGNGGNGGGGDGGRGYANPAAALPGTGTANQYCAGGGGGGGAGTIRIYQAGPPTMGTFSPPPG